MTLNSSPQPNEPGLTSRDREHIDRLLRAGHLATAAKLYRSAWQCSEIEAMRNVKAMLQDLQG